MTEVNAVVAPKVTPSKEQLLAQLQGALDKGDWKLVSQVSGSVAKMAAAEEKAAKGQVQVMVAEHAVKIKALIDEALAEYDFPVECDGVWYAWDFGDGVSGCRLTKGATATKRSTVSGMGAGKKYGVSTKELLDKFGDIVAEGATESYSQSYESNTDGNHRFKIRVKLLELGGYITAKP